MTNDVVERVLSGHPIRSDKERAQVAQAVADYENRLAGGEFGCGPAKPAVLSSQQLRQLADVREREERAERGEEPPVAWCGLGHQSYEADLEAAKRLAETKQQADKAGDLFSDEAWSHIQAAARQLREHWQRGYDEGRAEALAEQGL